ASSACSGCCSRSKCRAEITRARARHASISGMEPNGCSYRGGSRQMRALSARWWMKQPQSTPRRRIWSGATARRADISRRSETVAPDLSRATRSMSTSAQVSRPLLAVNNIEVIYDHVILVLKGVSLEVPDGRIVALLGANGAGKSTTLKAISNLLSAERGEVTKGSIVFDGAQVHALTPNELVRRGCIQVMEGRHCFAHLTVEENLMTGAFTRKVTRAEL